MSSDYPAHAEIWARRGGKLLPTMGRRFTLQPNRCVETDRAAVSNRAVLTEPRNLTPDDQALHDDHVSTSPESQHDPTSREEPGTFDQHAAVAEVHDAHVIPRAEANFRPWRF